MCFHHPQTSSYYHVANIVKSIVRLYVFNWNGNQAWIQHEVLHWIVHSVCWRGLKVCATAFISMTIIKGRACSTRAWCRIRMWVSVWLTQFSETLEYSRVVVKAQTYSLLVFHFNNLLLYFVLYCHPRILVITCNLGNRRKPSYASYNSNIRRGK